MGDLSKFIIKIHKPRHAVQSAIIVFIQLGELKCQKVELKYHPDSVPNLSSSPGSLWVREEGHPSLLSSPTHVNEHLQANKIILVFFSFDTGVLT